MHHKKTVLLIIFTFFSGIFGSDEKEPLLGAKKVYVVTIILDQLHEPNGPVAQAIAQLTTRFGEPTTIKKNKSVTKFKTPAISEDRYQELEDSLKKFQESWKPIFKLHHGSGQAPRSLTVFMPSAMPSEMSDYCAKYFEKLYSKIGEQKPAHHIQQSRVTPAQSELWLKESVVAPAGTPVYRLNFTAPERWQQDRVPLIQQFFTEFTPRYQITAVED